MDVEAAQAEHLLACWGQKENIRRMEKTYRGGCNYRANLISPFRFLLLKSAYQYIDCWTVEVWLEVSYHFWHMCGTVDVVAQTLHFIYRAAYSLINGRSVSRSTAAQMMRILMKATFRLLTVEQQKCGYTYCSKNIAIWILCINVYVKVSKFPNKHCICLLQCALTHFIYKCII